MHLYLHLFPHQLLSCDKSWSFGCGEPPFWGHCWIFIGSFWVRRGFAMILSHMAPFSFNMSSYRTIWTYFRPKFLDLFVKNNTIKLFLLGWLPPPTPLLFLGGFQPPRPLAGGLQPPVPPCISRGSASRALRFFLVPRSWYQDPGDKILIQLYQDPDTKILARHGTEIFGMARIVRAWHGNIWHGTDPQGTARKSAASRQGRNGRVFNKARNIGISDT